MITEIWSTLLVNPMFNLMVGFYKLTGNLGVSIILLSALIRLVLFPAFLPMLKTAKKQREIKPELDKVREKYKHDKKKMAEMQMALFKEHGINPTSGCLNQIIALIIPFALYGVIRNFSVDSNIVDINSRLYFDWLKFGQDAVIKTQFLYLNLAKPDHFFILPILTALLQFAASKMMMPAIEAGEKAAKKTPDKTDDMAYNMQAQMLYMMPVMMLVIGYSLPAGVMLNILVSTVFSIAQTYMVSGWGGLAPWMRKAKVVLWKK